VGTRIESVAIAGGGFLQARSARKLANAAAKAAIERAGLVPDDVDLLVNAGLYRDRNLGEPAMAALIQEDIGANPEDPHHGGHGTFSFDVANGACGVLTALQIADGFLRSGTISHALVVTSDANPGFGLAPSFPFSPQGGAALCSYDDGPRGLVGISWLVEEEGRDLFNVDVGLHRGHNELRVHTQPGFADRAAACAAKVTADLLGEHGLALDAVDLVVASPLSPEFQQAYVGFLGIAGDKLVTVEGAERVHTAGVLVGVDAAMADGRWAKAETALLVAAGAGITAGAALVRL
jgi:3-oxoacyl-[acyl-carrier-protein] synthase-3